MTKPQKKKTKAAKKPSPAAPVPDSEPMVLCDPMPWWQRTLQYLTPAAAVAAILLGLFSLITSVSAPFLDQNVASDFDDNTTGEEDENVTPSEEGQAETEPDPNENVANDLQNFSLELMHVLENRKQELFKLQDELKAKNQYNEEVKALLDELEKELDAKRPAEALNDSQKSQAGEASADPLKQAEESPQ